MGRAGDGDAVGWDAKGEGGSAQRPSVCRPGRGVGTAAATRAATTRGETRSARGDAAVVRFGAATRRIGTHYRVGDRPAAPEERRLRVALSFFLRSFPSILRCVCAPEERRLRVELLVRHLPHRGRVELGRVAFLGERARAHEREREHALDEQRDLVGRDRARRPPARREQRRDQRAERGEVGVRLGGRAEGERCRTQCS